MKHRYPIFLFIISIVLVACNEANIPKPKGYYRIQLPKLEYKHISRKECSFDILGSAFLDDNPKNKDWFSVQYPKLNGTLYFTFFQDKNIEKLSEDGRKTAFKHAIKADDILPIEFGIPEKHLYGLVYSIEGNAATPMILMMTDSIDQFLHATFYFKTAPNADSLRPLTHFIRQDAQHIIETFEWSKYESDK